MTHPKTPWSDFDEAHRHFEAGWRAADRGFDRAFEVMGDNAPINTGRHRTIRATTFRHRVRLARLFVFMAWRVVVRGKVTVKL